MSDGNHDRSIISAIQKMTGTFNIDSVYLLTGNVISVDEANGHCEVEAISGLSATKINNVSFQSVISDGVDFIPVVGSEVKVLFSKYTSPFIVQYGDIEKMFFAANQIQFNDGQLGGLIKIIELTQKLNNAENKINEIINAFNSHLHTSGGTGSPTTAPLSLIVGTLTATNRAEIEDTKIIH